MESPETMECSNGLRAIEPFISDDHNSDSDETASYDKLPEEVESFMDDVNSRLTVSRMVTDSVVKGIINAVLGEAAERVAAREAEIVSLVKKLQYYETSKAEVNTPDISVIHLEASAKIIETTKWHSTVDESSQSIFHKRSGQLKVDSQYHVKRLKEEIKNLRSIFSHDETQPSATDMDLCTSPRGNASDMLEVVDECADALAIILGETYQLIKDACSSKASLCLQQSEEKPQRETVVSQNMIREIQEDLVTKIHEQKVLVNTFNQSWLKTVKDLSILRQELDAISGSLLNTESGLVISHHGLEILEDRNSSKRKDHFSRKFSGNHHLTQTSLSDETCNTLMEQSGNSSKAASHDVPFFKSMTKEEVITHYKTEMTKMKRQHDLALQEKTEELFSLKREFLKEKGSNPFTFRREKDYELPKKIMESISRLDNILSENGEPLVVNMLQNLKQHIDSLHVQSLLALQEVETTHSALQISDVDDQTSTKLELQKNLLVFKNELKLYESEKIEAAFREEIEKIVLTTLLGEFAFDMEGLEMKCEIAEDICFLLCKERMDGILSSMSTLMENHQKETNSIRKTLSEKETTLFLSFEENNKLKQERESMFALVEEKGNLLLENEFKAMQQKEHNNSLCREINLLQDQLSRQILQTSETERVSYLLKDKLDNTLQQVREYEAEVSEMNHKLKVKSNALVEAEKQVNVLHGIIEDKQMELASIVAKEADQENHMQYIICSISQFSESILQFQYKLSNSLKNNESRLTVLDKSFRQLVQQANFLKKSVFWFKQLFEQRCSDLQKAENEVDLLGDEVDTLSRLLEKIYIALEHYYPVLQHYPGVVEILKLIRREMKKDNN